MSVRVLRGLLAAWLALLLPVLPAGAAVTDVPAVPAEVGGAPSEAGASLAPASPPTPSLSA
ncbi:MAG: hypothetical protein KGM24_13120, partial [Elusimicrobia bacterium]|nr:hypothetical protein [Elusimicrobiota bacterium]